MLWSFLFLLVVVTVFLLFFWLNGRLSPEFRERWREAGERLGKQLEEYRIKREEGKKKRRRKKNGVDGENK